MNIYDEALKETQDFGAFVGLKLEKVIKALERAKKEHELLELYQLKDKLLGDVAHGRMTVKEADSLIMATKEEIEALLEELK